MAKSKDASDIKEGFYDIWESFEELSTDEGVHQSNLDADEEGSYDTNNGLGKLNDNAEAYEY